MAPAPTSAPTASPATAPAVEPGDDSKVHPAVAPAADSASVAAGGPIWSHLLTAAEVAELQSTAPARHIRGSISALRFGEQGERRRAAAIVAYLAERPEVCDAIMELEGIEPLMAVLIEVDDDELSLLLCLSALRGVSSCEQFRAELAEKEVAPLLVALLSSADRSVEVRLEAAKCIALLAEDETAGSRLIDERVVHTSKAIIGDGDTAGAPLLVLWGDGRVAQTLTSHMHTPHAHTGWAGWE